MTDEILQSKTISFLRFPLIVGVVMIHCIFDGLTVGGDRPVSMAGFPVTSSVMFVFSEILARVAVPLFFFISGFLFFYKTERFDLGVYRKKIARRGRTILLPYVFWNLVIIAFYLSKLLIKPDLRFSDDVLVRDVTVWEWLVSLWDRSGFIPSESRFPINFPLWFIRDLMVVMLFSPVLYAVLRRLRLWFVALLGVIWIGGGYNIRARI